MSKVSKKLLSLLIVMAMVAAMVPATGLPVAATDGSNGDGAAAAAPVAIDNSDLELDADNKAICPVCGTLETWTAITGPQQLTRGDHYYLATNLVGSATSYSKYYFLSIWADGTDSEACLHLNGKSLISTDSRAIAVSVGTLNIMGNGTVSGTYGSATGGALLVQKSTENDVEVNIYGGTYVKDWTDAQGNTLATASKASVVYMTGGQINMYGGTVQDGHAQNGGNICLTGGSFKMTGGTVTGGEASDYGGNIYANGANVTIGGNAQITGGQATVGGNVYFNNANSTFTMTGGSISGGTATGRPDSNLPVGSSGNLFVWNNTSATISGGTIAGDATSYAAPGIKLSGNPVITKGAVCGLYVNNNVANRYLTVGKMTEGASIAASFRQAGAFTVANENAAANAKYFTCTNEAYNACAKEDNILYAYVANIDNSNLNLVGGKALCPVCGTEETWTPITTYTTIKTAGHYYLSGNLTGVGGTNAMIETQANVCLHLNGNNIYCTDDRAIYVSGGNLNIMGNGTVSGDGKNTVGLGLQVHSASSVINLYGGTFTHARNAAGEDTASATTKGYVVFFNTNGGTINMYNNVVIEGSAKTTTNGLVYMNGSTSAANFNMYGGFIQNGKGSSGANVYIATAKSTFKLYKGTIQDGKAQYGGSNVYVTAGSFKMYGGSIEDGGTAGTSNGGNVRLTGGSLDVFAGTITGGKAASGGNIHSASVPVTIGSGAVVTLGEATTGGNIYITGATVTTSGTISNGTATGTATSNGGGNVYVGSNATLSITGGQISGGNSGATSAKGGSILAMGTSASAVAKVVMTGGTISGGTAANASGHNIYLYYGNMTMTGGEIVAKDLNGVNGSAVRMTAGVMNLGGDATVSTEMSNGDIQYYDAASRVHILQGWSGSANVRFGVSLYAGDLVARDGAKLAECGTLTPDGTFTAADVAYTGKLMNATLGDFLPVVCSTSDDAAGALYVASSSLVDAENNEVYYATNADAVNAYTAGNVIKLHSADPLVLNGEDYYVDLNGNANVAISGSGNLYGVDTENDDFQGYGFATVADANEDGEPDVTVADDAYLGENRYIMLKQTDGSYEFHRLIMAINTVSLDTNVCGYFYKTTFQCDETLASRISGYGIAVSKIDVPGVDFATEEYEDSGKLENSWTDLTVDPEDYASFEEGIVSNSLRVTGIMKTDRYDNDEQNKAANIEQAQKPLYANAHITIDQNGDDSKQVAFVCYTEEDVAAGEVGASMTLVDVIDALDETYTSYGDTVKGWIDTFYGNWAGLGMADLAEYAGKTAWTNLGKA